MCRLTKGSTERGTLIVRKLDVVYEHVVNFRFGIMVHVTELYIFVNVLHWVPVCRLLEINSWR